MPYEYGKFKLILKQVSDVATSIFRWIIIHFWYFCFICAYGNRALLPWYICANIKNINSGLFIEIWKNAWFFLKQEHSIYVCSSKPSCTVPVPYTAPLGKFASMSSCDTFTRYWRIISPRPVFFFEIVRSPRSSMPLCPVKLLLLCTPTICYRMAKMVKWRKMSITPNF